MGSPEGQRVVVIAGATATGKSAVALALAERLGGVVINADASQLYADLSVLTARPSPADVARVPHRLYGVLDGAEAGSAAAWAAAARHEIVAALAAGRVPILVGGTGLYLRTLLDGIAPVPEIPADVRDAVRALPLAEARAALAVADPAAAARLTPGDGQRIRRALEVVRATGRTLADWQSQRSDALPHPLVPAVVHRDRGVLVERCAARVDAMLAGGAIDEVARLLARSLPDSLPVMRAIGVPPLAAHLGGQLTMAEARERIVFDTRRYAKRQATWWRNQTPAWMRVDMDGADAGTAAMLLARSYTN